MGRYLSTLQGCVNDKSELYDCKETRDPFKTDKYELSAPLLMNVTCGLVCVQYVN